MQADREDWIRHVGLLLGFRELTEGLRERIEALGIRGYTDRDAAELLRKQLGCSPDNTSAG